MGAAATLGGAAGVFGRLDELGPAASGMPWLRSLRQVFWVPGQMFTILLLLLFSCLRLEQVLAFLVWIG